MKGSPALVLDNMVVSIVQVGETFGEMALVAEGERPMTARAQTFSMCAKMHRATFLEVMKTEPETKDLILKRIINPSLAVNSIALENTALEEEPTHEQRARQSMLVRKMLLEAEKQTEAKAQEAAAIAQFRK